MGGTHLEDVVLVWDEVPHNVAELREREQVRHLVVVGVAGQPGLHYELIGALYPGHQTLPAHAHRGEGHLHGGISLHCLSPFTVNHNNSSFSVVAKIGIFLAFSSFS